MKRVTINDLKRHWPTRRADAHKGTAGRLYVVAGSKGMTGAAVLCARAALRSGSGLVRVGVPSSQQPVVAKRIRPEAMTDALSEDRAGRITSQAASQLRRIFKTFRPDVVAVGPGCGDSTALLPVARSLWKSGLPVVLDADGLRALRARGKGGPMIMTPHPGELSKALGVSISVIQKDRPASAVRAARRWHCVCVLKGAGTIVTDGNYIWRNTSGNSGMASGGMGDVLTGVISSMWGQMDTKSPETAFWSASLGVYLHGVAGDLAATRIGPRGFLAADVADLMPGAMRKTHLR